MNRWLLLALASEVTPLAEVVEHMTGMQETRVHIPIGARLVPAKFGAHVGIRVCLTNSNYQFL